MRRFKAVDKVRAFLDSKFVGHILDVQSQSSTQWLAEGVAGVEFYATVKLLSGEKKKIKLSELMHDDD